MSTDSVQPSKIDKYEILGVIGRGGMGIVYKARDPHIDRIVAIKTIRTEADDDNDQQGRLRMEARSAGKLHHPNIVTIFDFGEERDVSYIVMEFIEGVNLSRVMQKKKPVPLGAKVDVLMQVARGLAYAHECGVIHRDMKPSNICVTARGIAKILDFGLARYDNTRMTKTGYMSGTIAYMSPERFSGETGPSDDIFSLGAVAYEFLTLRRAFPGDTTPEVISRILGGTLPPPISQVAGYPAALDEIILRALHRDPTERYRKAADFEVALLDFLRSRDYTEFSEIESLSSDFTKPVDWSDESSKSNLNPYSSARSMSAAAIDDAPTVQAPDEITRQPTETITPPAGATVLTTKPAGVIPPPRRDYSTVSAPDMDETLRVTPKRRRGAVAGAIAALGLIVVITVALLLRDRSPERTVASVIEPPKPAVTVTTDTASRQSEVQLATASTLASVVAQRQLTAVQQSRLADANRQLDVARAKIEGKDYAGGAALIGQATQTLHDLLSTSNVRTTPPRPTRRPRTTTPPPVTKAPVTATTASTAPPPPPPVVETRAPEPVTTPRGPTRAELEREINSFVRAVASAYQEKDVSFFRQRSLRFNEQFASAIRNSPSTRVDIGVRDIHFVDDSNARVSVRRTDTFAEAGMPPGVQNLIYELRRSDDGWKIVTVTRQ